MKQFLLFLTFIFLPIAMQNSASAEKKEIVMGFNPAENAEVVEARSKVFLNWVEKKSGLKIKTFVSMDYTALVEALRSGRVDFAWLPPFSYVKAEQIAHATVLLKVIRHGKATYYSAIITRADKPYNKVEDLKGKNIAWVDPSSTTGHIIPKASLIIKKGIDPDTFFHKQIFAGAHDAVVLSVINGTVDAGATYLNDAEGKDGSWNLYLKSPEDRKKIKILFISDPIPSDTLATSQKFLKENPETVKLTVKTLIDMTKDPEGKKIIQDLYHVDGLEKATSKDFDPVRNAAKVLKID